MLKRFVLLTTFALLVWLILAPVAVAQSSQDEQEQEAGVDTSQETTEGEPQPMVMEETMMMEQPGGKNAVIMERMGEPLPESGGLIVRALLLPIAALLLGSGILAYAFLWRR